MTSETSARQTFPDLSGRAFAIHRDVRVVHVEGSDARAWLNDLVTADVASLAPGMLRPSLLLGPTGRVRASFAIAVEDGSTGAFLLMQPGSEPSVAGLLAPYVLSSSVLLSSDARVPVSLPVESARVDALTPSLMSLLALPGGTSVTELLPGDEIEALAERMRAEGVAQLGPEDLERLRILSGIPRLGVDLDENSLPAEAAWEERIDLAKGCFLGQESVAKVRNLGHPPRAILAVTVPPGTAPGERVLGADGAEVGLVTSSARGPDGTRALVRVRWEARDAALRTGAGPLRRSG